MNDKRHDVWKARLGLLGLVLVMVALFGGQALAEPPLDFAPTGDSAQEGASGLRQGRKGKKQAQRQSRHGWVRVYTTSEALVTIDGKPYPRRSEYGAKVTANERHDIKVRLGEKEKTYVVLVRPRELKTFLVDLTGYQSPPAPDSPKVANPGLKPTSSEKKDEESEEEGKLTVYSKPKGEVYVDGSAVGATTPMINRELEIGRHEIQVKWETGVMSEVKTIRIRKGSKLKLFFRDRGENK